MARGWAVGASALCLVASRARRLFIICLYIVAGLLSESLTLLMTPIWRLAR